MVPVVENDVDKIEVPEAWGFYAGLQWQVSPRMFTSATYSTVQIDLPESESGSAYKNAQYVVANIFYNLTPSVRTGIEYIWGCRENLNGTFKQNTRIQTAVRVNF
jgi:predicted porin